MNGEPTGAATVGAGGGGRSLDVLVVVGEAIEDSIVLVVSLE